MGPLQPVHHWTLDFGQMESDARVLQAMIDLLKAFERRGIDYVHRGAHQHDMFELRPLRNKRGDAIFQIAGIGEIKAFINPQGQDFGRCLHPMALDIAEVLGAWQLADNGHVRARSAVEMEQQR